MKYSNEEKLSIISRYQQGESIATLSDELNIPRSTLYRWLNSFPTDSAGKPLKFLWGDRIFEKCGIGRDEGGDGGKTLEIRGKRRLSARDGGANYQQS